MTDKFKTSMEQEDIESSPLLSHYTEYTEEESYQDMYTNLWRNFQMSSLLNGVYLLIAASFLSYVINNWSLETVDPDVCISDRDRRKALLLSLFLGTAGADRFYLGYPISACFKSVLGGIFNVWWIIDLIRLWTGSFYDVNGCVLK